MKMPLQQTLQVNRESKLPCAWAAPVAPEKQLMQDKISLPLGDPEKMDQPPTAWCTNNAHHMMMAVRPMPAQNAPMIAPPVRQTLSMWPS